MLLIKRNKRNLQVDLVFNGPARESRYRRKKTALFSSTVPTGTGLLHKLVRTRFKGENNYTTYKPVLKPLSLATHGLAKVDWVTE